MAPVVRVHLPMQMEEAGVRSPGQEDPLEEGVAAHSNILAWRIPWREEPGGLQSIGSLKVKCNLSDLAHTKLRVYIV